MSVACPCLWGRHCRLVLLLIGLCLTSISALAHESRPAYLELIETTPNRYTVLFRTPVLSGMRLPIALQFSPAVRNVTEPVLRELPDSLIERRLIETGDRGLTGERVDIVGLEATITDVLVRLEFADGTTATRLIKANRPWLVIEGSRSAWQVAMDYSALGVEHILSGFDHLLFVLALMLIVRGWRRLLLTITAFTLAHSITLAAATLGYVWLPGPPVEATIALSIVFLASELLKVNRGEPSLTASYPWVVAFIFGLLHGLGFAGALTEVGLPQSAIPLALLMFNVGVELGQLLFVGLILALAFIGRNLRNKGPVWARRVPAYGIGILAGFWFLERVAAF